MKKLVSILVVFALFVGGFGISSVSATSTSTSTSDIKESPTTNSDNHLMVRYLEVGLPIAKQGSITNYQLGKMIQKRKEGALWLTVINTVAGAANWPAGVANSLAQAFATRGDTWMDRAYIRGESVFWVSMYASGVVPSLSKKGDLFASKTPVRFVYYGN